MAGTQSITDQDNQTGAHGIESVKETTPNQSSLERVHNTFCQCPLCGQKFAWQKSLCEHIIVKHDAIIAGVDEFWKVLAPHNNGGLYRLQYGCYDKDDVPVVRHARILSAGEAHRILLANLDCVREART